MKLSAYGKIIIINNMPLQFLGDGELADTICWDNPHAPAGIIIEVDNGEIIPSPQATESLVLFFRNMITRQEYLGYTNNRKTFVTIDGVNYEVRL